MCNKNVAVCTLTLFFLFSFSGPVLSGVRYVKWNSPSNGPGYSWNNAYHTIMAAINYADVGDEIWVAGNANHPYKERITLQSGVALYGGFCGEENTRSHRNWLTNKTIIDGNQTGTVVTVPDSADSATIIDGFTIQNGKYSSTNTGSGIYCLYAGSPIISHNTITGNDASYGGGIYCSGASPTIINNSIVGNNANEGGGIYCTNYSSPITANNNITYNTSSCVGGAIYCFASSPALSNNIVAFNSSGIYRFGGEPDLQNNDFYQNLCNYEGISAGAGDISEDPKLKDDFHIISTSPCVDSGIIVADVSDDMDGQERYSGTSIDIGVDECWPLVYDAKKLSDDSSIALTGLIIIASFSDCYYVESADRMMGIRVEKPTSNDNLILGAKVKVAGQCRTNANGERCIMSATISELDRGFDIDPLGMNNRNIGNGPLGYQEGVYGWIIILDAENKPHRVWGPVSGHNNIGLLIKTWGKVTDTEPGTATWFRIDDGSDLNIKCICTDGASVCLGDIVFVTGIVSCEKVSDELHRIIRVRTQADITSY